MTKKTFQRLIVLLVLVAAIVVAVVIICLGSIIKEGVNMYGPQIAKVPVSVDAVSVNLFTSSAEVKGLVVGNPPGYKTPQAVSVGDVHVEIDPTTVFADKIVVHYIDIGAPEITFEGGLTGNNLSQILDNVNGSARTNNATVTTPTGKTKAARKLEVDSLSIIGAKVHVNLTGIGGKEMTLTLPDIHLSNLGTGPNGITPAALTSQVFSAITSSTLKAVESQITNLGGNVENLGKGSVKSVKSAIGNLFK